MTVKPSFSHTEVVADAVSQQTFRDAMAKMGAAVNIVTSDGPAGKVGFAATAVCSVTDTPPTLLVCLNRSASVFNAVMENRTLCVNVLSSAHDGLSNLFGGRPRSKNGSQRQAGIAAYRVPRFSTTQLSLSIAW